MRRRHRIAALAASVFVAYAQGGCSLIATFGERAAHDGDAGEVDAAGDASASDAQQTGAGCPGAHGPKMVRAGAYCIDATEVTNRDYAAFVAARVDVGGQSARCAWNTSFAPDGDAVPLDDAHASLPVARVDWCDAAAFCAWAGKRLCGKISGGALDPKNANLAGASQWYAACSGRAGLDYPYSDSYDSNACRTEDSSAAPVGSFSSCEGGDPGIFDMSGNVAEWEDACVAVSEGSGPDGSGDADVCDVRGGAFDSKSRDDLGCKTSDASSGAARSTRRGDVGFRCCGP